MAQLASLPWSLSSLLRLLHSWKQKLPLVLASTSRATHGNTIAVLIDGENTSPSMVASILAHAGTLGEIAIGRVYGNWASATMNQWLLITTQFGLEQQHHGHSTAGKNATDIKLSIDAVDLLKSVNHFCLASNDSDYVPLVWRLRSAGRKVMVIGGPSTALALKQACTVFVPMDQRTSLEVPSHPDLEKQSRGVDHKQLSALLLQAYTHIAPRGEWVSSSQMGAALGRIQPLFTPKTYGHKKLSSLLLMCTDLFETRTQQMKGGHIEVEIRLRQQKQRP